MVQQLDFAKYSRLQAQDSLNINNKEDANI